MKITHLLRGFCTLLGFTGLGLALVAAEAPSLDPHLDPLRPWLGRTWKGQFHNAPPDRPTTDVAKWERALNGTTQS